MSPDTPIRTPPFLKNFGGLVLGCIDTSDSESRRIFSGFSRPTRFPRFCTTPNSKFQPNLVDYFVFFKKILYVLLEIAIFRANFDENSSEFRRIF